MNCKPVSTVTVLNHGLTRGDIITVNGQSYTVRSSRINTITIGQVTRLDRIKSAARVFRHRAVNSFWRAYDTASDWCESITWGEE